MTDGGADVESGPGSGVRGPEPNPKPKPKPKPKPQPKPKPVQEPDPRGLAGSVDRHYARTRPSSRAVPLALVLLASALTVVPGDGAAPRDNVLVLVADDMGVERTPAYGLDVVPNGPTPWIDALAGHGVLFRNAYAEPLCSPTRSAILTGRHPFRTGIGRAINFGGGAAGAVEGDVAETSLADVLGPTHRTSAVGKWHLALIEPLGGSGFQHPVLYGFDTHRGPIANLTPGDPDAYVDFVKNLADASGNAQVRVTGTYATTDQVDDALDVIEEAGEEPWFVWLAFNAPHTPYHVPPSELTTLAVSAGSSDSQKHRAAIEAMDTEIGRLLRGIRPAVLARTWVVFVGDNGSPGGALPGIAQAKGTVSEFGVHVPLIVAGPRVRAPGREVDALVGVTDLFATICDMARVPVPATAVDSVSVFPHLLDPAAPARRATVFVELFEPNGPPPWTMRRRAVRDARFKLRETTPAVSDPLEFFHLATDPFEEHDLLPTPTPEQAAVLDALAAVLDELSP